MAIFRYKVMHDQPSWAAALVLFPWWVFQYFVGIHLLILTEGQGLVLNLNEHHQDLLELLGQAYEAFYS